MKSISAFVGHSFSEEDKPVTGDILDVLNTIKETIEGFEWVNARSAEPGLVSKKVVGKIKEADIFIGICTRQKITISLDKAKKVFWTDKLIVNEKDLEHKVSDWLLQEIGAALGLDKRICLLVEEETRIPEGLAEGLEYIKFSRKHPKEITQKLLQTITSLKNDSEPTTLKVSESSKSANPKNPADKELPFSKDFSSNKNDFLQPKKSWTMENYENAMFCVIFDNKSQQEIEIKEHFMNSDLAKYGEARAIFESKRLYNHYVVKKVDTSLGLENLVDKYPRSIQPVKKLASIYEGQQQPERAMKLIENSITKMVCESSRVDLLATASLIAMRMGDKDLSSQYISKIVKMGDLKESDKMKFLEARTEIAKINNDNYLFCFLGELLLSQNPDDDSLRFDLAYRYDKIHYFELSFFHYDILLFKDSSNTSYLNNIGVSYSNLGMEGKSLEAYKQSMDKGSSLSAGNFANSLSRIGYFSEAESICKKFLKNDNCDPNVSKTLSYINDQRSEEESKKKNTVEKARGISKVILNFANEVKQSKLQDGNYLLGREKNRYFVKVTGEIFEGKRENICKPSQTFKVGKFTAREPGQKKTFSIKGQIVGRVAIFSEKESKENADNFSFSNIKSKERGVMAFSEDLKKVKCVYFPSLETHEMDVVKSKIKMMENEK